MKDKPISFSTDMVKAVLEGRKTMTRRVITPQPGNHPNDEGYLSAIMNSPYQVGDILWVKETWCPQMNIFGQDMQDRTPFYKADDDKLPCSHRWRPSIHMPRWASRIALEVTDVKVERLQEITEEDAIKEGLRDTFNQQTFYPATYNFETFWASIYGKESWESNPWVWVTSFKRVRED